MEMEREIIIFNNYSMQKVYIFLIAVLVLISAGCSQQVQSTNAESPVVEEKVSVEKISFSDAHQMIEQNQGKDDFVILDVRTPEEYETGCLKDAVNIDFNAPDFREKLEGLDKTKTYLVHCRSGKRSATAIKIMQESGFTNIYDLNGGIMAWADDGGAVDESCPA